MDTNISHSCLSTRRMEPSSGRAVSQHMVLGPRAAHMPGIEGGLSAHTAREHELQWVDGMNLRTETVGLLGKTQGKSS